MKSLQSSGNEIWKSLPHEVKFDEEYTELARNLKKVTSNFLSLPNH